MTIAAGLKLADLLSRGRTSVRPSRERVRMLRDAVRRCGCGKGARSDLEAYGSRLRLNDKAVAGIIREACR